MTNSIINTKDCESYIKGLMGDEVSPNELAKMERMMLKEAKILAIIRKKRLITYQPRCSMEVCPW